MLFGPLPVRFPACVSRQFDPSAYNEHSSPLDDRGAAQRTCAMASPVEKS